MFGRAGELLDARVQHPDQHALRRHHISHHICSEHHAVQRRTGYVVRARQCRSDQSVNNVSLSFEDR